MTLGSFSVMVGCGLVTPYLSRNTTLLMPSWFTDGDSHGDFFPFSVFETGFYVAQADLKLNM